MSSHKRTIYPPAWVLHILGERSPDLNNALVRYTTALLQAIEANASCIGSVEWLVLLRLHGRELSPVETSPGKQLAALCEAGKRPGEVIDSIVFKLEAMDLVRANAVLAVVNSVRDPKDPGKGWYTKNSFLARHNMAENV